MLTELQIIKSDKSCYNFEFETNSLPKTFTFPEGNMKITKTASKELPEFSMEFSADEDISLYRINICADLCKVLNETKENILVFNGGSCTNAFAKILKLDENDNNSSRELFLAKGTEKNTYANFAFTSFNKFYTCFTQKDQILTAFWHMEDKTIKKGTTLTLESFTTDTTLPGNLFFDRFSALLARKYNVKSDKPVPAGWSSWSCLYHDISEDKIIDCTKHFSEKFRDRGATLMQMDDGWQKGMIFDIFWTNHEEKFPHGIDYLGKKINEMGMDFGIWMAPGLVRGESEAFDEFLPHIARNKGELVCPRKSKYYPESNKECVFAMNISEDYVKDLVRSMFRRAKDDGVNYFKVDFLVDMLYPGGQPADPLVYDEGYSTELFRELMRIIRETVGPDVFLLACGAPIGETIGYFDAIRVSPDITWGGAENPTHPGAWNIMRMDAQNTVLRNAYHRKLFINDPDAVLLRNFGCEHANDGLNLSFEEAKMWISTIAMCGGHQLLNEETEKIPEDRLALFYDIIPPLGIAAKPKDFFEYPWCSESYIDIDNDTRMIALYNWGDDPLKKVVDVSDFGKVVAVDCFDKNIIGVFDNSIDFGELPPHTTRTFVVKKLKNEDMFLYSDDGFYLGANTVSVSGSCADLDVSLSRKGNVFILASGDDAFDCNIIRGGASYSRVDNPFSLNLYKRSFS